MTVANDLNRQSEEQIFTFIEYKVQAHDTLEGIALSHNLNPKLLMKDNELSSDTVYSGQMIKIRSRKRSEEFSLTKRGSQDVQVASTTFEQLQNETSTENKTELPIIDEWEVFYSTSIGDVAGKVKMEKNLLKFTPVLSQSQAQTELEPILKEREEKLKDFVVVIDVRDIQECNVMAVPHPLFDEIYEDTKEYVKDYLLQIILKDHGENSYGKYFDKVMMELKNKDIGYACLHFKAKINSEREKESSNRTKHKIVLDLQNAIMDEKTSIQEMAKQNFEGIRNLTKIPYVEFLYEKFEEGNSELLRRLVKKHTLKVQQMFQEVGDKKTSKETLKNKFFSVFKKITKTLKFNSNSQILSPDQFSQLIGHVPSLFQSLEWELKYSTKLNGTSISTLLRKCEGANPVIILIQDEHKFAFGAYVSGKLQYSKRYSGNGETFLFSFWDLEEISVFNWTKKNSLFLNASEEGGILLGAGPQYGLWINKDLTKGRSGKCDTFDNSILSLNTEFQIIRLEVWALNSSTGL